MLIRIVVYAIGIALTWELSEYIINRNFFAGVYPPESDSISIPIISNQILLTGLGMFLLPTTVIGNRWFFGKLSKVNWMIRLLVFIPIGILYLTTLLLSLSTGLSFLDEQHFELAASFVAITASTASFFILDALRIYRIFRPRDSVMPC
jgi:hypothetical protein